MIFLLQSCIVLYIMPASSAVYNFHFHHCRFFLLQRRSIWYSLPTAAASAALKSLFTFSRVFYFPFTKEQHLICSASRLCCTIRQPDQYRSWYVCPPPPSSIVITNRPIWISLIKWNVLIAHIVVNSFKTWAAKNILISNNIDGEQGARKCKPCQTYF